MRKKSSSGKKAQAKQKIDARKVKVTDDEFLESNKAIAERIYGKRDTISQKDLQ